MKYTEYEVLFDPSNRHKALLISKSAIDIQYNCPECGKGRAVTWLFPDEDMIYPDDCCHRTVAFKGDKNRDC